MQIQANEWTEGTWESILSKNGIEVFSKKENGSDLLAFKAVGILDAPMDQILSVLQDFNHAAEWNKNLIDKRIIRKKTDIDAVSYTLHGMPWPVEDREMVLRNTLYLDLKDDFIYVVAKSIKDDSIPKREGITRAILKYGVFKFRPSGKDKTYVELFAHIDPKGNIPSWIFNLIQQNYPYSYLKEIEKQVNTREFILKGILLKKVNQFKKHLKKKYPLMKVTDEVKKKPNFKLPYSK